MCGDVTFYRPKRGPFSSLAIWTSHREVAREALRRGQARILVLEDDLNFLRPWDSVLKSIRKAVTRLPAAWFALVRRPFPAARLFRRAGYNVRFCCNHARLCRQQTPHGLAGCDPADGPLRARPFANDRPRHRRGVRLSAGHVRAVSDEDPAAPRRRVPFVRRAPPLGSTPLSAFQPCRSRLASTMGRRCAIASPLAHHAPSQSALDCSRGGPGGGATPLRRRLLPRPKSRCRGSRPGALEHFVRFGSREGRNPNAWFDTCWYMRKYPDARQSGLTAFEHYLWRGRSLSYRPNDREQNGARSTTRR